jgi:hypothetical protein
MRRSAPTARVLAAFALAWLAPTAALRAQEQAPPPVPAPGPNERIETYPSGAVQRRYTVDDQGKRHGRCEEFAENGTRTLFAVYSHGLRDGEWKEWRADGQKVRYLQYHLDDLHGQCEEFHDNGRTASVGSYREGQRHGKWIETDRDGVRRKTAEYREGYLHGSLKITVRDKVVSKQTWRDGDLLQLDDLTPLPASQQQLRRELHAILAAAPSNLDKDDPLAAERQQALRRLAAYRRLCGLSFADLMLVPEWNLRCDAAAEACRRLGHLDHTPPQPPDMDPARYRLGYEGASHSNLASGGSLEASVDQYMDDSDGGNIDRVGHRRWCLNPPLRKTGFGHDGGYSAMWSMDESGNGKTAVDFVAYPPHGYTPTDLFDARRAFSIGTRKGAVKKDDLKVDITALDDDWGPTGKPLDLDWCSPAAGGFGGLNYIVFRPVGIEVSIGAKYLVEVSTDGGKTKEYRYLVAFCAPTDG